MAEERAKEEELARLAYMEDLYSQQYSAIMNEIATFGMAQGAVQRNLELLEKMNQIKGSILLNGEGGTYIEANVKSLSRILAYVGAGYLVESDAEKAKTFLKGGLEKGNESIKKLVDEKRRLEDEILKIRYSIEALRQ